MRRLFQALIISAGLMLVLGQTAQSDDSWPDTLVIGTAGRGGTYDAYGQGLTNIAKTDLHIAAATRETTGPEENLDLVAQGKIQIGFATLGAGLKALKDPEKGAAMQQIRAIAPMYDTAFQFVVEAGSSIQTLEDLDGKIVGVGPAGGTSDGYVPRMLKALGVNAVFKSGDWAGLGEQLAKRNIDLLAVAGGTPFPALLELGQKARLRFIPLSTDEALKLRLAIPELTPSVVAVGVYPWEKEAYQSVGMFNFIVVHRELPSSLVIALLDALYLDNARMIEFSPAAAETTPRNVARNNIIPFHGGAVRWYEQHFPQERGD